MTSVKSLMITNELFKPGQSRLQPLSTGLWERKGWALLGLGTFYYEMAFKRKF